MAEGSYIRIKAVKANLNATTVNSIIQTALVKQAISITQKPQLRKQIGEEFVEIVTPFVPAKTGKLREQGGATTDGRVFWTATNKGYNYASNVYDEDYERWPKGTGYKNPSKPGLPNATPRWVEKVHPGTQEWTAFINNITPIIKEAFARDE